jgi:hypothetical protein
MSTATANVVVVIESEFITHLMVLLAILQKVQFLLVTYVD